MKFDSVIMVRVSAEMRQALDVAMNDDGRSTSNFVRKLIADHLRKKGYLKASPRRKR